MGEVVWGIGMSLDGRCGHEGMAPDEGSHRESAESFAGFDALVMGRVTYELMFPFWATVADEQSESAALNAFALAIVQIPKVVFSRTLDEAGWNTRVVSSSPVDEVRRLRDEGARLNLGASPALANELLSAGLVDRFHLVLHPVAVGQGPMLFRDQDRIAMALDAATPLPGGHVVLDYTVVR
jgi:dihydrofolate reductase